MLKNSSKLRDKLYIIKKNVIPRVKYLELLSRGPRPIIYLEKRLVLFWSAKADCTFSVKWMFAQMGVLEEIERKHNWLHNYRAKFYYGSSQHELGLYHLIRNPGSFYLIKVVDDPFKRAVRSYIHACIYTFEDSNLTAFLHREVNPQNRFSFREFAQYLSSIDITKCDLHLRCQISEIEKYRKFREMHIIKLDNSMEDIKYLEKSRNLKEINLDPLRISQHHRPKYKTTEFVGDKIMNEIHGIKNATIPEYKQFYDEEIKERIAKIYLRDFERYNFDTKFKL